MKRKKIGIVGHFTGGNSFGITKPYMRFFSIFGDVLLLTPWDQQIQDLDLLVLPGGPDVEASRYVEDEEDYNPELGNPCMVRERFDRFMLPKYIDNKVPIFGICRGHQTLAVHYGSKLNQHMFHETSPEHDRNKLVHKVEVDTIVAEIVDGISIADFEINSLHHQTVMNCPENANVIARYIGKHQDGKIGDIEALSYFPHYPAHTVQWHPEEIYDDFSMKLVDHLLTLNETEELNILLTKENLNNV